MMRAKLSGYMERPRGLQPLSTHRTKLPARYARAIASYFQGGPDALEASLVEVDALIRDKPDNPYFWEVKGDLLMRRAGRAKPLLRCARR